MRYSQLKAFHSVAIHGGFSRAAEAVRLTQPALSEHVRRLEQDHDVLLFHRDRKRVRLTEDGEALLLMTKRLFEVEEQIGEYLSDSQSAIEGTLRIVADSAHHITGALQRFRARHPKIFVSLSTGNTDEVLNALRAYDAEIGVVGSMNPGSEFQMFDLGATPIIAFAAKGFLGGDPTPLTMRDLTAQPLVFREKGSKTRAKLLEEASRQKVKLTAVIEVEGREAMREVVASGTGIGFVSAAEYGDDSRLVQVPLKGIDIEMSETLVSLTQRGDVRVISAFMDVVRGA